MATTLKEGAEIINTALKNSGYDYQIDTTSDITITQGLEAIGNYSPEQRSAIMSQMNLIVQTRNFGVLFTAKDNPFREFVIDMTNEGFGIEDIFHELIEGAEPLWDGNGTPQEIAEDLVSDDTNKIHQRFHTKPITKSFETVIDMRNYKKVFLEKSITSYVDVKLSNLSNSAEFWLMNEGVNACKEMISKKDIIFKKGLNVNTADGLNNAVESIKRIISGFKTPCKLYNKGYYDTTTSQYVPVVNCTRREEDIYIITTPEFFARIKTQGYSNAFNLSQYEIGGRVLFVPDGTDLGDVDGEKAYMVIIDRKSLVIGIRNWVGTTNYIPNVLKTKHWLLVEGLRGYNTFTNAICLTGAAITDFANA